MIEFLIGAAVLFGVLLFVFTIALITMMAIFTPNDLKDLGWFALKLFGFVGFIVLAIYIGHWLT